MVRLTDNKKTSYILLLELTFNEVRSKMAVTLKVAVKDLPKGLDQMVFMYIHFMCVFLYICINVYMYKVMHMYICYVESCC
jgi:hypothetical protein